MGQKTVRVNTIQPITTRANATTKIAGAPNKVAVPKALNSFGNSNKVRASVTSRAAPRATFNMPRVTMKEGTLQKLTINPFMNPQPIPTAILVKTASVIATGTGSDSTFRTSPATIALKANTEPTERSIPPIKITNVIPIAIIRLMVTWVRMLVIFDSSVKWGASVEKAMTIRSRAIPIPASRSTRWIRVYFPARGSGMVPLFTRDATGWVVSDRSFLNMGGRFPTVRVPVISGGFTTSQG